MQHDAQLPQVGGGGDRRIEQLFRRGVFERQCAIDGHGARGVGEFLGDAEVEQLHPALGIDQQVGRLQVAMHHQVAMRVAHGIDHLQEQHDALAQAELPLVAPAVDGLAIHQLHDEPGVAFAADAAVQQGGDVRVAQPRQDLPFAQEALARRLRIGTGTDQLQRGVLRVRPVVAVHAVHRAHAAVAENAGDAPRPDAAADQRIARHVAVLVAEGPAPRQCIAGERLRATGIRHQQGIDGTAQPGIVAAGLLQPGLALGGRDLDGLAEQGQGLPPAFEIAVVAHLPSSANRKARAVRQSRRTVRSLTPSICAISVSS